MIRVVVIYFQSMVSVVFLLMPIRHLMILKKLEDAKLPKQVQSTNVLNYKQTIKSLLINEIKRPSPAAEMDLFLQKYLEKLFPGSNKAPYNLAFQEAVNEVKKMNVQPIDIDELNEEHIKFSKKINSFCKEMNKEFKKEFGKMGFWGKVNAWTAGFGTKRLKFINDKEKELLTLVDQLAKKQSYGALLPRMHLGKMFLIQQLTMPIIVLLMININQ